VGLHFFKRFLSAQGGFRLIALLFQNPLATFANDHFVIDDQYSWLGHVLLPHLPHIFLPSYHKGGISFNIPVSL
jgi:hypothetical protein